MRRALPWILLALGAAFGARMLLDVGDDAATDDVIESPPAERVEPMLRGSGASDPVPRTGAKGPGPDARSGEGGPITLPPFAVEGRTRFQRRLSAGGELLRVRRELEAERLPPRAALERLQELAPTYLLLDQVTRVFESGSLPSPEAGARILAFLTDPRRDAKGLALDGVQEATDPLGTNLRLRTWTVGGALGASAVRAADALLARLDSHAGVPDDDGYDVLATPAMGNDVFPEREFPWPFPAAGYYTPEDELCVVGTHYDPSFVALVLRHELVHAWQHRHLPAMQSRFLQEGLAEYLSRLESSDYRLEVPPDRIRNEFAALLKMLGRMQSSGISWQGVVPARLLTLDPPSFYRLGHMGYLLGLATFAYVGGDTVERALKTASDGVLAAAVREIDWADFLRFLGEHGADGDPALATWIQDGRGGEAPTTRRTRRYQGAAAVLRSLGVRVPAEVRDRRLGQLLEQERAFPAQDAERVDAALRAVLAGEGRALFLVDVTTQMGEPLRAVELPPSDEGGLLPGLLEPDTRQAFAELLRAQVLRGRAPGDVATGCLGTSTGTCSWPVELLETELTLQRIPEWLRQQRGAGTALVVCLASKEMQREAVREAIARALDRTPAEIEDETVRHVLAGLLTDLLDERGVAPTTVLVVDLADGESDALALAQAFAAYLGDGANVAYWNPQRALR